MNEAQTPTTPDPDAGEHAPELPQAARRVVARPVAGVLAVLLAIGLSIATLELFENPHELGMEQAVAQALDAQALEASGVQNPVTAVLLNYRAYDTWLELGVLWLAVMGMLILQRSHDLRAVPPAPPGGYVLTRLICLLVPVMVLVAGYVLWRGTRDPGGAFQAGALLAAAGVLLRISGIANLATIHGLWLRCLIVMAFLGLGVLAVSGWWLQGSLFSYPAGWQSEWIFVVEVVATLAIAAALVAAFAGAYPVQAQTRWPRTPVHEQ